MKYLRIKKILWFRKILSKLIKIREYVSYENRTFCNKNYCGYFIFTLNGTPYIRVELWTVNYSPKCSIPWYLTLLLHHCTMQYESCFHHWSEGHFEVCWKATMDVGKWLEILEKFWQRWIWRNWLFKWLHSVTRLSKDNLFFILNWRHSCKWLSIFEISKLNKKQIWFRTLSFFLGHFDHWTLKYAYYVPGDLATRSKFKLEISKWIGVLLLFWKWLFVLNLCIILGHWVLGKC